MVTENIVGKESVQGNEPGVEEWVAAMNAEIEKEMVGKGRFVRRGQTIFCNFQNDIGVSIHPTFGIEVVDQRNRLPNFYDESVTLREAKFYVRAIYGIDSHREAVESAYAKQNDERFIKLVRDKVRKDQEKERMRDRRRQKGIF